MAVTKPCPGCRATLEIPQPPPDRLQCPQCGATVNLKAPAGAIQAESPPPRRVAERDVPDVAKPARSGSGLVLVGVLGAFLLLGCLCVTPSVMFLFLVMDEVEPRAAEPAQEDPGPAE